MRSTLSASRGAVRRQVVTILTVSTLFTLFHLFLPPLPFDDLWPSFRRQPIFLIYRAIASWKWILLLPRAHGTVCPLLKPCPFNVRPESPFAVSAAIHIPPPSLSISASYWLTPERSAPNPTPLHYFKLHLTCLAWPHFFSSSFTSSPPLCSSYTTAAR